jgi:4-hydroxy-L-threonine phosphate dehydrogenase PdxA
MKSIAITVGDPSGIGPEISLKAARDPRVVAVCRPVLYGPHTDEELKAFPIGKVNAEAARAAYNAIERAVADARRRLDTALQAPRVADALTQLIDDIARRHR